MTGCGAPGAPGIIRCLRKNGERDIRIVAVDRNENAGARDLVDAFYTVPSAEKEDFLPAVLDICRRESVQVVIPIVTRELMKFARARAEFEALGAKVSVMEPDKLEIVNNKAHLLDAMRAHGLRTPEYRRVHTVEKLKAAVSALGYPEKALCVKAAVGNGSRGIRMLNANISRFDLFFEQKPNSMFISYEEMIRTLSERETMPEMLVMEYLPGTEYSVDFLADHGEPIYTVSRRGLSVVTSNMMSLVVDDNPAVKEICTQVVRSLELDGNFGFDLLYNANDETPYVIEINPRLTAGVVSCAAAGVNLPYLGMKRLLGEPLPELTAFERYRVVQEQNSDFVGWLSIPGTNIDYPVMQTVDKPNFYLKRGFDKQYSDYGVPYVQENCDLARSDNCVIYSHHMNNGTMFADLCKYENEDFYREHKTIRFDTLSGFSEYEIVAVFKTVAYSERGFKYYHFICAESAEDFGDYIVQCKALSLYDTGVTAKYGDKLITLSTCEYSRKNGRMVVVAKRIAAPFAEVGSNA